MKLAADDLGVLANLAIALGVFTPSGDPNPDWFGNPEASLANVLANDDQRHALLAFIEEAMGGAGRTTDSRGVVWLPVVHVDDPDLTISITVDESHHDGLHVGLAVSVRTTGPASRSSLAIPLFRTHREGGPPITAPLLLGSRGGRIRLSTAITLDDSVPVPGRARLGAIGIDLDVPTSEGDADPVFGVTLSGLQLPGAMAPRDIRVAADGLGDLDAAALDLILALVKVQADAAAPATSIAALGGLLGLRSDDDVPDFPIDQLTERGPQALAAWMLAIVTTPSSRHDWMGHLAALLGGRQAGDDVSLSLGSARLTLRLSIRTGPTGNGCLTPSLSVELGTDGARVEAHADLFQLDLVTGAVIAVPHFGAWAAAGRAGSGRRILDTSTPIVARADTLRVGFAIDSRRRLTFVLAADMVRLGSNEYPVLDLTSPDALMDAANATVSDVADELLAGTGDAVEVIRVLLGLEPPAGVAAVALPALMTDPVAAVSGYWGSLVASGAAMSEVLASVRDALADVNGTRTPIRGTGVVGDPWRVRLTGALTPAVDLELWAAGSKVSAGLAVVTSVDALGERCTVVETRLAVTIAEIDLEQRSAIVMPQVEGLLSARERGADPPRVALALDDDVVLTASGVGLRLTWSPTTGLRADIHAPDIALTRGAATTPIVLPVIASDGTVAVPVEAWDGIEALVGHLGVAHGGALGDLAHALGWTGETGQPAGDPGRGARLPLRHLTTDPAQALAQWLTRIATSDLGLRALEILADLFGGRGAQRGVVVGAGRLDSPYRLTIADGLPSFVVWVPPDGPERRVVAAAEGIQRWRPGDPGLEATTLAAALRAEGGVARDVEALIHERDLEAGLDALVHRWVGGDGLIVPPVTAPSSVTVIRTVSAAGQYVSQLDLDRWIGREPTTTVYVALGVSAWPAAPEARRIDLTTPRLDASMFAPPAADLGDWFVCLGTRGDCKTPGSTTDGTPEQASRLTSVLARLASVTSDIVVVAVGGAGHAARLAAQAEIAVTDLVTLGTPLSAVALTALSTQPTADALRVLHRLLPVPTGLVDAAAAIDEACEDEDAALGRALVSSMMALVDQTDPTLQLRLPSTALPEPRAGLTVSAVFGALSEERVRRAMTAIVVSGLAERARAREATPFLQPTGVRAGLGFAVAPTRDGALSIRGDALLSLFAYDTAVGASHDRALHLHLRIGDRTGWLTARPGLELRMVSVDVTMALDGVDPGHASITLHDARVFGQSWERLILGSDADTVPVLPEARVLLAAAVQRLTSDVGAASIALRQLLTALSIIDPKGGLAADAVDQFVHDPTALLQRGMAVAGEQIATALATLLGPVGRCVDFSAGIVRVRGGDHTAGRFGWLADVSASRTGMTGLVQFGPADGASASARFNLVLDVDTQRAAPFQASLRWYQPSGGTDVVPLWPRAAPEALTRMIAKAVPSLGAQVALELMRHADEAARPVIDAALDALGLLNGAPGDAERSIRPLAGFLADPAGWLSSADSLGASPAKIQGLFDALRPLLGVGGGRGAPLPLASGVSMRVVADGANPRLVLEVDPTEWTRPSGVTGRLSAGLTASLLITRHGPPAFGLDAHVGLTETEARRQAVHMRLGPSGIDLFLRPAAGADIALVPFAGLGALVPTAEAALPFLLDRLGEIPGTSGDVVRIVGDALNVRSGRPRRFDRQRLHAWGVDPVGALAVAAPAVAAVGLGKIAAVLDDFLPAEIAATATDHVLTVTAAGVSLSWDPARGSASLEGNDIDVPGIHRASFVMTLSRAGLDELSVTIGPAEIDAQGVTLRPFVSVSAGARPLNGRRIAVGLAVDGARRFAARWTLDPVQFDVVASDGHLRSAVEATSGSDPAAVAFRLVEVVADLVAAVAMAQAPVDRLLEAAISSGPKGKDVRFLLTGVVLDPADPTRLIAGLFEPDAWLSRLHRFFGNLSDAGIVIAAEGLRLSFATSNGTMGLAATLVDRMTLVTGDVMLWLESDGAWIAHNTPPKSVLFVGFLPSAVPLRFTPSLAVHGLGLRIGKTSGPLLDVGPTLESIGLHLLAEIDASGARAGGVQLQLSHLAVPANGASGDNGVARGIMRDAGPTPPQPAFSPALAIQKHGQEPVSVTLRAGEGAGPWWIAIQRGFGPLYLEQVGVAVSMPEGHVERIALLMDGSVSMFGLTCAVDDLQITYIAANGDLFSPSQWAVDLAGLAVSAEMAGVTIAGGLLKQTSGTGVEYLGMLLGRFATYGLTMFGGYGEGADRGRKCAALFAVGAVNGPIGGPPAFFLTGIGAGFGINRRLIVPTDLAALGNYPLVQALDIATRSQEPMAQLRALGQRCPAQKGTFWFAAGLSFNSWALVDGIAVVAAQVGGGLDLNLLGLARMALPRPQAALVSIELALQARFSSSEGVVWVQGQLTDHSWLLHRDIKVTGGFAFVIWFTGEHAGEFVLTLGGYHPNFHRAGYPQLSRLGLRWSFGRTIVVKAQSYFALTSEALMTGGDFEVSATFGPAWAEVRFSADGVIAFDPFRYHVSAYARIAAGVTIDRWTLGEVPMSVSLGGRIEVSGPEFHGRATFEVGPVELAVEFGGRDRSQRQPMNADAFVEKYLELGESGAARTHAVMTTHGASPSNCEHATPDGSSARPFIVAREFGLVVTSTVPAARVTRRSLAVVEVTDHVPSRALGVAPMNAPSVTPVISLEWRRNGAVQSFPFITRARAFGRFPVGIWGPPQDADNRAVPKAEMIEALHALDLVCSATPSAGGPEIPYFQVEPLPRKPLPFTRHATDAARVTGEAKSVADLVTQPRSVAEAFAAARAFLSATATRTALAALRGERQSPPLLGTLGERIEQGGVTAVPGIGQKRPSKVFDHFIDPPVAVGWLSGACEDIRVAAPVRTTVEQSAGAWRIAPPTLASVEARRSKSIAARLVVAGMPGSITGRRPTIVGIDVPPTAVAHGRTALVAGTASSGNPRLHAFSEGLRAASGRARPSRVTRGTAGASLAGGDTAIMKLPNARADASFDVQRPRLAVSGAPARIVILGFGGAVVSDGIVSGADVEVVRGAERIVAIGQGNAVSQDRRPSAGETGLAGWYAGKRLVFAGWSTAVAPGCVVRATGASIAPHRERREAGWVTGAELTRGVSTVTTTFATPPSTVIIVLDDPAAFGGVVDGRTLLLGLDGAVRSRTATGADKPPVLLMTDSRSVLAYDIVPDGARPVIVSIASESGWSLVGVMGAARLDAAGAIALVSARGLDAAIRPFAPCAGSGSPSVLRWSGPTRTIEERRVATHRAGALPLVPAPEPRRPSNETSRRSKRKPRTPPPAVKLNTTGTRPTRPPTSKANSRTLKNARTRAVTRARAAEKMTKAKKKGRR